MKRIAFIAHSEDDLIAQGTTQGVRADRCDPRRLRQGFRAPQVPDDNVLAKESSFYAETSTQSLALIGILVAVIAAIVAWQMGTSLLSFSENEPVRCHRLIDFAKLRGVIPEAFSF